MNTVIADINNTVDNPLLNFSTLINFNQIQAQHIEPAIEALINECTAFLAQLEKNTSTSWEECITPLENVTEKLSRAWGVVEHLCSVLDSPSLRAAYNENQIKVTQFWTTLAQNNALLKKYQHLQQAPEFSTYSAARKQVIQNALRDFYLGGAQLADDKKELFIQNANTQAAISTKFSENILDATNDFSLLITNVDELSGLPDDVKQSAYAKAQHEGKQGYLFSLHFPSYFPILQFADNRQLRETIYHANVTRASDLGANTAWDNTEHIATLLQLRQEEAHLLGLHNFAQISLTSKMATDPTQVIDFLEDLAKHARIFAEHDILQLRDFAKNELGIDTLCAWDTTYASEKLRQKQYAFSEHEVKQYFQKDVVLTGLFNLIETLFNVTIRPDTAPTWHQDVEFFRVEKDHQLLAQFYIDLYARPGKRSGAWMDHARSRRLINDTIQTPIAYLVCNFTSPNSDKPALLSHDDVITLFHEFGHGLHHMLTQVDELSVSGIAGVEWDAVELPSQLMENFCWEWDVLKNITKHVNTQEPLPRDLFDKMIAAKNFQSGLHMLRQVELSLIDMHLHLDYDPANNKSVQNITSLVYKRFSVMPPPPFNRFPNTFSHVFSGGYAAGYYSYLWAQVLSADAYGAFETAYCLNKTSTLTEVGQQFFKEILSMGGARPAIESFKAFLGRAPKIDALLRHNGMVTPSTTQQ